MCRVGESPPTEFHDCDRSLIAPTCNGVGSLHPSFGGHAHANRTAIVADFLRQDADEYFCSGACLLFTCPAFVRAPRRGFSCALRQLALLLWLRRPAGYGFPPNLVRKKRPKRFLRTLRKCRASALGSMAHSLNWCPRPRSGDSTNGDTHVPEQSNRHSVPMVDSLHASTTTAGSNSTPASIVISTTATPSRVTAPRALPPNAFSSTPITKFTQTCSTPASPTSPSPALATRPPFSQTTWQN